MLTRRRLIQTGFAAAASVTFGPAFWRDALAAAPPVQPGAGPYGALKAPDVNGIMLPDGFSSRVIARSGTVIPGTGYTFPIYPDGSAAFALPGGEWVLAVNTEQGANLGGVSAIRFDALGNIISAQRILSNTSVNCAGGPTPWGTWLSGEEHGRGMVWECDPTGVKAAVERPKMGVFVHEAVCVDDRRGQVYLSEDIGDGGLYRFTPTIYPDLASGTLEVACDGGCGKVIWRVIADPEFKGPVALRHQHADTLRFARGEGIWYDAGLVYLATTTDNRIWVYDTQAQTVSVLYHADSAPETPLRGVDNLHVSVSGDLFVAEDSYTGDPDAMDVCLITPDRTVSRFLKLTGAAHNGSETVGITFDPTGSRMYIGSQRYAGTGIVYEIAGPFRTNRLPTSAPPLDPCPPPANPPAPPATPITPTVPGLPVGIDFTRRITFANLIRRGLALGVTLDKAATVRVRVTARITRDGRRRTVTLASAIRKPGRGMTMLRIKPTKAQAKLLRGRRRTLAATVEVRIITPGEAERTFKRSLSIRP